MNPIKFLQMCKPNVAYYTGILQKVWLKKRIAKKLDLPNYND
jgi:hypothetical protein